MYTRYVLKPGDVGIAVNKMQAYLNMFQERGYIQTRLLEDGKYGANTTKAVKEAQKYFNLAQDGVIGNTTWDAIVDKLRELGIVTNIPVADASYYLTEANTGIDVFKMQEYLNVIAENNPCLRPVPVDGNYGRRTLAAVSQFQYLYDLSINGNIDSRTWDAIVNNRNELTAGS